MDKFIETALHRARQLSGRQKGLLGLVVAAKLLVLLLAIEWLRSDTASIHAFLNRNLSLLSLFLSPSRHFWITWLSVACAVALGDICWAKYFIEIGNKAAVKAGVWSSMIIALGAYSIVQYVHSFALMTAAMAGAFVGTYCTVRRNTASKPAKEAASLPTG